MMVHSTKRRPLIGLALRPLTMVVLLDTTLVLLLTGCQSSYRSQFLPNLLVRRLQSYDGLYLSVDFTIFSAILMRSLEEPTVILWVSLWELYHPELCWLLLIICLSKLLQVAVF